MWPGVPRDHQEWQRRHAAAHLREHESRAKPFALPVRLSIAHHGRLTQLDAAKRQNQNSATLIQVPAPRTLGGRASTVMNTLCCFTVGRARPAGAGTASASASPAGGSAYPAFVIGVVLSHRPREKTNAYETTVSGKNETKGARRQGVGYDRYSAPDGPSVCRCVEMRAAEAPGAECPRGGRGGLSALPRDATKDDAAMAHAREPSLAVSFTGITLLYTPVRLCGVVVLLSSIGTPAGLPVAEPRGRRRASLKPYWLE